MGGYGDSEGGCNTNRRTNGEAPRQREQQARKCQSRTDGEKWRMEEATMTKKMGIRNDPKEYGVEIGRGCQQARREYQPHWPHSFSDGWHPGERQGKGCAYQKMADR